MKRVVVVGAGEQGGPCASILARDKDISEIVLGDIDLDLANKVKNRIKSDKITTIKVDAGKVESVESAAKGADAIINLTLPQFNANIMRAALNSGAQYVDSALDYPFIAELTENKPLAMDDEFKRAGLTALVGCGATPGVSNVLTKYVCDKLDRVDAICIRCGGKILELAQKYAEGKDSFLFFATENRKNGVQIQRAYYSAITDAIEGCFAFETDSCEYEIETSREDEASYADALAKAIEIEEKMEWFYEDAAEQSKSLLADISRTFARIAKKRDERITKLRTLRRYW